MCGPFFQDSGRLVDIVMTVDLTAEFVVFLANKENTNPDPCFHSVDVQHSVSLSVNRRPRKCRPGGAFEVLAVAVDKAKSMKNEALNCRARNHGIIATRHLKQLVRQIV